MNVPDILFIPVATVPCKNKVIILTPSFPVEEIRNELIDFRLVMSKGLRQHRRPVNLWPTHYLWLACFAARAAAALRLLPLSEEIPP